MRTLAKIVGAIVVCLVLALVVLRITGFNPIGDTPGRGNYPGLWLSGTVVTTPVTDWSFVSQYQDRQTADANLVHDSSFGDNRFHPSQRSAVYNVDVRGGSAFSARQELGYECDA